MINKLKELYKKYEEVILYLFFGVLTTIISVGLYWLLGVMSVSYTHLKQCQRLKKH